MEYHKGGRFGRITKAMISEGFESYLDKLLYDSMDFSKMKKSQSVDYVEDVINRMDFNLGKENTQKVLRACGRKCCGKSWANFVKDISNSTETVEDFFELLNKKEEAYNTGFVFDKEKSMVTINRNKCICGLVNKAKRKFKSNLYCECSTGHFLQFFESVFIVESIELKKSILSGSDSCEWVVKIKY